VALYKVMTYPLSYLSRTLELVISLPDPAAEESSVKHSVGVIVVEVLVPVPPVVPPPVVVVSV